MECSNPRGLVGIARRAGALEIVCARLVASALSSARAEHDARVCGRDSADMFDTGCNSARLLLEMLLSAYAVVSQFERHNF